MISQNQQQTTTTTQQVQQPQYPSNSQAQERINLRPIPNQNTTTTTTTTTGGPVYQNGPSPISTHTTSTSRPVTNYQQAPIRGDVIVDRRIDADSARSLARRVFSKYDSNRTGQLNSTESASMIRDLYASLNADVNVSNQDGVDLMSANDVNRDNLFNQADFEEIFVKHLSTGDHTGYRLFYDNGNNVTSQRNSSLLTLEPTTYNRAPATSTTTTSYRQPATTTTSTVIQQPMQNNTVTYQQPMQNNTVTYQQQPNIVRRSYVQ